MGDYFIFCVLLHRSGLFVLSFYCFCSVFSYRINLTWTLTTLRIGPPLLPPTTTVRQTQKLQLDWHSVTLVEMGRPRCSVIWVHHNLFECEPATETIMRNKQTNIQPCRAQKQQYKTRSHKQQVGKGYLNMIPNQRQR